MTLWISVIWIYVLPLIADQGLGFGEAASRSNRMVKGAGWWWTFGMVILLGLAALAAVAIVLLVVWGVYQGSDVAGIAVGLLLFLVFAILFPPYTICYVSVMYIGSARRGRGRAQAAGCRASRRRRRRPRTAPAQPTYGTRPRPRSGGPAAGATGATMPAAPSAAGRTPGKRRRTRWRPLRRRRRSPAGGGAGRRSATQRAAAPT